MFIVIIEYFNTCADIQSSLELKNRGKYSLCNQAGVVGKSDKAIPGRITTNVIQKDEKYPQNTVSDGQCPPDDCSGRADCPAR